MSTVDDSIDQWTKRINFLKALIWLVVGAWVVSTAVAVWAWSYLTKEFVRFDRPVGVFVWVKLNGADQFVPLDTCTSVGGDDPESCKSPDSKNIVYRQDQGTTSVTFELRRQP